jgi:hypothetical protein
MTRYVNEFYMPLGLLMVNVANAAASGRLMRTDSPDNRG